MFFPSITKKRPGNNIIHDKDQFWIKFLLLGRQSHILYNMRYRLEKDHSNLTGRVGLPASKSISNRLLILNALADKPGTIRNLSESDDTQVLLRALDLPAEVIDIGHAGTAMRFLTAYLSIREGKHILTGSERMQNRPIKELVDALNSLDAAIRYAGREGYPPLAIQGRSLEGGEIAIDSSISSQYISALMMIGPVLHRGLKLHLQKEMVSSSYIRLTRDIMLELGIPVEFSGDTIQIPHHEIQGRDMLVEADWSAAGYWYAMAAFAGRVELDIEGLSGQSYQGDAVLPALFLGFGVQTEYIPGGIRLSKTERTIREFNFDFRENPDLVQTMAVVCGLMDIPFQFGGTKTLKIKETDRVLALRQEMARLGILLDVDENGNWIRWDGKSRVGRETNPAILTYQDHRMAMAFAPAAMKLPGLIIEDPMVVHKSYPRFWDDLVSVGYKLHEV
jgi:3-phosphoshikimate 1-carboxyvinyltransferase